MSFHLPTSHDPQSSALCESCSLGTLIIPPPLTPSPIHVCILSSGAALSLCFLAQAYEHSCHLIHSFLTLPVGEELLVQVDRLVELLESPCFTFLRLQMLQPARHPFLLRACYSLLMLLPQSNAFRKLNTRLQSLPTLALLQLDSIQQQQQPATSQNHTGSSSSVETGNWADWDSLLSVFKGVQATHCTSEQHLKLAEAGNALTPPTLQSAPSERTSSARPLTGSLLQGAEITVAVAQEESITQALSQQTNAPAVPAGNGVVGFQHSASQVPASEHVPSFSGASQASLGLQVRTSSTGPAVMDSFPSDAKFSSLSVNGSTNAVVASVEEGL